MSDVVIGIGGDISDLKNKLKGGETAVSSFSGRVAGNVRSQFGQIGQSIAGAFAAGAIVNQMKSTLDHFGAVQDMADRLNTTAESIQKLDLMGAGQGASAEMLVNGLTKVTKALDDVENKAARDAFGKLGINMEKLSAAKPEEQIMMLADGFQAAQAKGEGFKDIFDLMGKSAGELIPTLRQSRADLQKFADTPVVSDEQVAKLDEIGDKLTLLKQKITMSLGSGLASFATMVEGWGERLGKEWVTTSTMVENMIAGDDWRTAAQKAGELRLALDQANDSADKVRKPIAPIVNVKDQGISKKDEKANADKVKGWKTISDEIVLLAAKATGNKRIIEGVTKEMELRERTLKIMKETGATRLQALDMAKQMQALEDKAERASNRRKGIANKIHGAHGSKQTSGLDEMYAQRGGSLRDSFSFSGLDNLHRLQDRHITKYEKHGDKMIPIMYGGRKIPLGHAFDALPHGALAAQAAGAMHDARNGRGDDTGKSIEELMKQLVKNTKSLADLD